MSQSYRKIEPAAVLNKTANAIAIGTTQVNPFSGASVFYDLRHIDEPPTPPLPTDGSEPPPIPPYPPANITTTLLSSRIDLYGEDYAAWGSDDNYLYEKVCEKLGLTLIPEAS